MCVCVFVFVRVFMRACFLCVLGVLRDWVEGDGEQGREGWQGAISVYIPQVDKSEMLATLYR